MNIRSGMGNYNKEKVHAKLKANKIGVFSNSQIKQILVLRKAFTPFYNGFFLLKEGLITVRYDDSEHVLVENNLLLLSPRKTYEFISISKDVRILIIATEKDFHTRTPLKFSRLDVILYIMTSSLLHIHFPKSEFNEMWQLTSILENKLEAKEEFRFKRDLIHNLFSSFLYLLAEGLNRISSLNDASQTRGEKIAIEFIRLLVIHFKKHHTISFYANHLNITTKHLSETLKSVTGYTASELINMSLISKAKTLLINEHFMVGQVAVILNFSDQYAFSKFFKRLTQMSPSEYIKKPIP